MDINKQLKENILEEMLSLPKETQEVINAFVFQNIFTKIGKDYKFSEDEIKKLETETILVLIGLVNQQLFSQNIENNIGISEKQAKEVEREITEKIFNPIYIKVIEKIKNNIQSKNPSWNQRVNFIISGGDYSNFIEK